MARDSQRAKVYAWEKLAHPGYWTSNMLTPTEVRVLVRRIHRDIRAVNERAAPENIEIKFTKRSGGACGSWRNVNFTPGKMPLLVVLHEVAHSLTWGGTIYDPTFAQQRDPEGHGSRFVACMLALFERYAGIAPAEALRLARGCFVEAMGPWRVVRTTPTSTGVMIHKERSTVKKHISVAVNLDALRYWRTMLAARGAA